jgi:1-acyl-sn-glycerol-3-phosphate acyltransferase
MTVKQNTYFSPINNLSFIDHFIFNLKLIVFAVSSITLIFAVLLFGKLIPFFDKWLPVIFHKLLIWLLSIQIELEGEIDTSNNSNLYISNHLSYLDIPILGSTFPMRFVAKSEVEVWPLFGFLAKLGRTIFISRKRSDSLDQKNKIFKSLSSDEKVFIFPEGTTSDGNRVLDFKSSSFSALEGQNFSIQPIVIVYSDLNGIPINRWLRPVIAWYGDMDLKPHLLKLASLRSIKVKLIYLDVVNTKNFCNRKDISNYLENKIKKVYSSAISKKLAK